VQIRTLLRAAQEQGWLPDSASLLEASNGPMVFLPFGQVWDDRLFVSLRGALHRHASGEGMALLFENSRHGPWVMARLVDDLGSTEFGSCQCRNRKLWVRLEWPYTERLDDTYVVDRSEFEGMFSSDRPMVWPADKRRSWKRTLHRLRRFPTGSLSDPPKVDRQTQQGVIEYFLEEEEAWLRERRQVRLEWQTRRRREWQARRRAQQQPSQPDQASEARDETGRNPAQGPLPGLNAEDRF